MPDRKLEVEILGDPRSLEKAFGRASKSGSGLGRSLVSLGKVAAFGVGAAFAGLAATLKVGFGELSEGQKVAAQTGAVLKSTGGIANTTAKEVENLAGSLSRMSGVDDELLQSGENMLLTFTNVRNEVGKGNDIFNQATGTLLDMSTALGTDMSKSAIQLGKALNDPIKGVGALARVGVTFTEGQKKTIKALVESGDTMGAQKLILAELNKEFGGSAKAFGTTLPGQLSKLKNSFEEVTSQVAGFFLPALTEGLGAVSGFVTKFAQAKGFKAKLNVVWTNIKEAGSKIETALRGAFAAIDWGAVWSAGGGIARGLGIAITTALAGEAKTPRTMDAFVAPTVDWELIADRMIDGLTKALEKAGDLAKQFADLISRSFQQIDWASLGATMAPGLITLLGTAFVTALDPMFWAHHWELALAIGAAAFSGAIGKWAVKLGLLVLAPVKAVGARMVVALVDGLMSLSSRLAAVFVMVVGLAVRAVLAALRALGQHLEDAIGGIFKRLGAVAREVLQAGFALAAIEAIKDMAVKLATGIADLAVRVYNWIRNAFADAGSWLFSAGAAIIGGLAAGIRAGVAGALQSAIDYVIGFIPDFLKKRLGISSPSKVTIEIGKQLAEGLGVGFGMGTVKLGETMAARVQTAIDKMIAAVSSRQGALASAFDTLVSAALAAFDKLSEGLETRTEKKLRLMDERAAKKALSDAIAQARSDLAAANTALANLTRGEDESAEDFAARYEAAVAAAAQAHTALNEAIAAQQRAALEKQAAQERENLNERQALRRRHLEEQLAAAGNNLQKILAVMKKFGIPIGAQANKLGLALAEGLNEARSAVAAAARRLAQEIQDQLGKLHIVVSVSYGSGGSTAAEMQHGGPVRKGMPYIVGEKRPELFVPNTAGRIVPNLALAGGSGGGTVVHQHFHIAGSVLAERELMDLVQREGLRYKGRNGITPWG